MTEGGRSQPYVRISYKDFIHRKYKSVFRRDRLASRRHQHIFGNLVADHTVHAIHPHADWTVKRVACSDLHPRVKRESPVEHVLKHLWVARLQLRSSRLD